ncbi:MAG TPA: hypothetical protein VNO83_10655, partial [Pseudonocardia sp.]|nr:hypothetical protein [Pseudonocardia sp.]
MTATLNVPTTVEAGPVAERAVAAAPAASAPSAAAHLTDTQIEALAAELDELRAEVVASLGEADARYIHRVINTQRALEIGGRAAL